MSRCSPKTDIPATKHNILSSLAGQVPPILLPELLRTQVESFPQLRKGYIVAAWDFPILFYLLLVANIDHNKAGRRWMKSIKINKVIPTSLLQGQLLTLKSQ